MKKLFLTIVTALLMTPAISATRTVGEHFADTRADSVFDMLTAVTRLDMLDYYRSGMTTPSKNALEGQARILSLTDTMLTMRYGAGIVVDIVRLDGPRPTLMVIETVPLPEADSHLSFYDENWRAVKHIPIKMPMLSDWLTDQSRDTRNAVERAIPFMTYTAAYDPTSDTLTFTQTISSYFGDKAPDELRFIKPRLEYRWTGSQFRQP